MSLAEKFRSQVLDRLKFRKREIPLLQQTVSTAFEPAEAESKADQQTHIETLTTQNEGLAPLVNWQELPPHITPARPGDFKTAYQDLLRLRGVADPETVMEKLLAEIRYLDEAGTTEAIQILGNKLKEVIGLRPYCFIYLGDERTKTKSGYWIGNRLQHEASLVAATDPEPVSLGEVIERIQAGQVDPNTQLIIADDLSIFWEQISDVMLVKLIEAVGKEWLARTHVALIAGTDVVPGPQQRMLAKVASVSRVYRVETLDDIHLSNLPFGLGGYITYFAHHRVSDRFYIHLLRSVGWTDQQGQFHYLVDDMKVPPPYDPGRFTTGSWSYKAKTTPE